MFEQVLNAANGKNQKAWDQNKHLDGCGEGVCSTVVVRWLKYNLVGSDSFWAVMQDAEKGKEKWRNIKAKQAHYGEVSKQTEAVPGVHFSGQYAAKRLAGTQEKDEFQFEQKTTKIKNKFKAIWLESSEKFELYSRPDDFVGQLVAHQKCGSYVSLTNRQSLNTATDAHAVGAFRGNDDKIHFFDPNMGQVSFDNSGEFRTWVREKLLPAWKADKQYQYWAVCQITNIRGLEEYANVDGKAIPVYSDALSDRKEMRPPSFKAPDLGVNRDPLDDIPEF